MLAYAAAEWKPDAGRRRAWLRGNTKPGWLSSLFTFLNHLPVCVERQGHHVARVRRSAWRTVECLAMAETISQGKHMQAVKWSKDSSDDIAS